jgi:leucyl-tRNA synthetase
MPVDLYVGGAEHATLHLLYARFWHKVLYDVGVVSTIEPFQKLFCQGMILGEDHEKMSKSRGNTVSPDEVIPEYGADAFRLYEMFMGPLTATKPWQTSGLSGTSRFLKRVWRLYVDREGTLVLDDAPPDEEALRAWHTTLAKVTEDIDGLAFNTSIAAMMELVNVFTRRGRGMPKALARDMLVMLSPFAPHLAEELNVIVHGEQVEMLAWAAWPELDDAWLGSDEVEIAVQVNGRVRATIHVPADADAAALEAAARADPAVAAHLADAEVKKVVAVPGRIVNFVVGKA